MARVYVDTDRLREMNEEANKIGNPPIPYITSPVAYLFDRDFVGQKRIKHSDYKYDTGDRYFASSPFKLGSIIQRPVLDLKYFNFMQDYYTMQNPDWPYHCRIMERDYLRCLARVGLQNEDRYCRIYRDDVMECSRKDKSKKRMVYMQRMRKEKGLPPLEKPPLYTAFFTKDYNV